MENRDGVWWDGIFYYKDLTNAVKLSHQQMNHNFEMVASLSQNMTNQVDMSAQSAAEALASQRAAALSETAASQSAGAANTARTQAQTANTAAQDAKNEVNTKAQQVATDANQVAQDRQAVAGHAQQVSAHAQQVAADKAQVASDKQASEAARNTATQKAGEANQSAIDAEYWAGQSQESAGAVTSVQGKDDVVLLYRSDFSWMGSAAEADLTADAFDSTSNRVMQTGDFGWGASSILRVSNNTNLNLLNIPGTYALPGTANMGDWQLNNYPKSGVTGSLLVFFAYYGVTQIFIPHGDHIDGHFVRHQMNSAGNWTGWYQIYTSRDLQRATQAEVNAGTQAAPRLFSPKQLSDTFVAKRFKKMIITESGEVAKPTDGPMIIVLYGGGGRGNSGSSTRVHRGGTGAIYMIYILNGSFIEDTFPVLVAAPGGDTEALGHIAGGGSNATISTHGGPGEVIKPQNSFFLIGAENGLAPPSSTDVREPWTNPVREGLADPSLYGFGGFNSSGSGVLGGPGLVEIYY